MTTDLLIRPRPGAPIVDDATRREFIGALTAFGLLAACGNDSDDGASSSQAPTRRVTDLTGRVVDIPTDPQRIVVLDPNKAIVDVVALGFVPVGATTSNVNPGAGFAPTLGGVADRIESVGVVGAPNLERITELRPDLIFYATNYSDLDIDTLDAIAPVVTYEFALDDSLSQFAVWLGREREAAALLDDLEALFAERKSALDLSGRRVAVVSLENYESGSPVIIGPGTSFTNFVERLGAVVAPAMVDGQPLGEGDYLGVSVELLPDALADVDTLVVAVYGGEGSEAFAAERTGSPLWAQIPAVQRGDVAYLNVQELGGNYGLAGVEAALDDLTEQLGS